MLLELSNADKTYGTKQKVRALDDFSMVLENGEMLSIMGKSGSGKSTILNIISGIDRLDKGTYFFDGQDMSEADGDELTLFRRNNIGFVLQHFALMEDYTIFENIALPLRLLRKPKKETGKRVEELADMLEITEQLRKYPSELSGGQAQRAAIARAIINQPKLLLADEPTGALDENTGAQIMKLFHKLNAKGMSMIIVTHDASIAQSCRRTIHVKDGKHLLENKPYGGTTV